MTDLEDVPQILITNKNALTLLEKTIEALRQARAKNTVLGKSNAELQDQNLELLKTIKRLSEKNVSLCQENETLDLLVTRAENALEIMALRFASHQIGDICPDTVDSLAASAYAEAVRQESEE